MPHTNSDKRREYNRAYYAKNSERQHARMRAWRAAHPEQVKELQRAYRERNRELIREQQRAWLQTPHGKLIALSQRKAYKARRRAARLIGTPGTFTSAEWRALVERSRRCHWCKRRWTRERQPVADHVVPLSRGGPNSIDNIVCSCTDCNERKRAGLTHPVSNNGLLL